jgi:type IV fimbrial biogenesis protein FimT
MRNTTPRGAPGWGAGFSLAEVLVVMALLAVLLVLAVPAVSGLRARHELQAVAEEVWQSLVLARSQALAQQTRVVLCPAVSDGVCDLQGQWAHGWLVFVDSQHNGWRDADEPVLQSRGALPVGVRLQGNSTVNLGVRYGADGLGQGLGGTLTVCKPGLSEQWTVVINMLGRPRMEKVDAVDCR